MIDSRIEKIRAEIESYKSAAEIFLKGKDDLELWLTQRDLCKKFLSFIDSLQEPATSVWHDAKDTPVTSKTKIVLYTNGKWDMFKACETKDNYDNYWAGVNQALEEKGVLVKRWAYVEDLLKL